MFGIEDPGIYIAYLAAFGCLLFSLWYGIAGWNEEDGEDEGSINAQSSDR
ncbi:hypothetical protein Barb4_00080 [Bacteroidales bacterium Barb4]|nr:hypothetical protein Barb4_00080 [Bacteroidales bacterium Barb4]